MTVLERPERVWSDLYGCPRALWQGAPGGHRWLLVTPAHLVEEVTAALSNLRFKGSLHLLVTGNLTPLQAALREVEPRGAVIAGETLGGGPHLELPARAVKRGDFAYREGGPLPSWTSALPLDAPEGRCAGASLCAQLGVPVVSAAPKDLASLLQTWWSHTPHGSVQS